MKMPSARRSSRRPECTSPFPCCRQSAPAARRNAVLRAGFVAGSEGAGCAFAMNEQVAAFSRNDMRLDLAGIVGDIEQQAQVGVGEKVAKNPSRLLSEDFAIGERA